MTGWRLDLTTKLNIVHDELQHLTNESITLMPYTLSHAVVALPVAKLSKHKIPMASVVVGSISPDFPYLLALTPTYAPGHSATGPLLYCLLPSLLILFIWHGWLEKPNKALFALPMQDLKLNLKTLLFTVLGILIGAYSHALWDASSHANGALVISSEFWQQSLGALPVYKWNQYISGVVGLAVLCVWYLYSVLAGRNQPYRGHLKAGVGIYSACILFFIVFANWLHDSSTVAQLAVRSALGFMVGASLACVIYAVFVNRNARSKKP